MPKKKEPATTKVMKPSAKKKVAEQKIIKENNKEIIKDVIDKNIKEESIVNKKHCCHCGSYKDISDFTKSRSPIYKDKRIHICKQCIGEMISNYLDEYKNMLDSLMIILSITNTFVFKEALNETLEYYKLHKSKKKELYEYYVERLDIYNKEYSLWNKTYLTFECSNFYSKPFVKCRLDDTLDPIDIAQENVSELDDNDEQEDEVELTELQISKMKKKWGDKDIEDLIWLDEREKSYYEKHDVPNDHIHKSGIITLCHLELQEFQAFRDGKEVKQIITNKEKVLKNLVLNPKKKSSDGGVKGIDLGTLIKKREQYKPIVNKDPYFDDIDNISSIAKALSGALCRTANIETPLITEFEKIMKPYTFDFTNIGDYDD